MTRISIYGLDGEKAMEVDMRELDKLAATARGDSELADTVERLRGQALFALRLAKSSAAYFLVDDSRPERAAVVTKIEAWMAEDTDLKNPQVHAEDIATMTLESAGGTVVDRSSRA